MEPVPFPAQWPDNDPDQESYNKEDETRRYDQRPPGP